MTEQHGSKTPRSGRRVLAIGLASLGISSGVASAIIWAKLRLVGDVPRTVYAEPEPEPKADPKARDKASEPTS